MYFSDLLTVQEEPAIEGFEQRKFDTRFNQSLDAKKQNSYNWIFFLTERKGIRFLAHNSCADESFVFQTGFSRAWDIFKSFHFYI